MSEIASLPSTSAPLSLILPPKTHIFSHRPADFQPENLVLLYSAALAEKQIVFLSSQLTLLTAAAEVLVALLYPMHWCYTYSAALALPTQAHRPSLVFCFPLCSFPTPASTTGPLAPCQSPCCRQPC